MLSNGAVPQTNIAYYCIYHAFYHISLSMGCCLCRLSRTNGEESSSAVWSFYTWSSESTGADSFSRHHRTQYNRQHRTHQWRKLSQGSLSQATFWFDLKHSLHKIQIRLAYAICNKQQDRLLLPNQWRIFFRSTKFSNIASRALRYNLWYLCNDNVLSKCHPDQTIEWGDLWRSTSGKDRGESTYTSSYYYYDRAAGFSESNFQSSGCGRWTQLGRQFKSSGKRIRTRPFRNE